MVIDMVYCTVEPLLRPTCMMVPTGVVPGAATFAFSHVEAKWCNSTRNLRGVTVDTSNANDFRRATGVLTWLRVRIAPKTNISTRNFSHDVWPVWRRPATRCNGTLEPISISAPSKALLDIILTYSLSIQSNQTSKQNAVSGLRARAVTRG